MNNRSIRAMVLKEVALVSLLLTAAMTAITVALQMRWEKQGSDNKLNSFESVLKKDQDGLLLQLLLEKSNDLNFYFTALKEKFPTIEFCLNIHPAIVGLDYGCSGENFDGEHHLAILGNQNYVIRYSSATKPWIAVFKDLLRLPIVYSGIL